MQKLGEEIANAVSHGIGSLLAIAGTVLLIVKAAVVTKSALAVCSVSLYGASMIFLYTMSCIYHSLTAPRGKKVFRIFDHCSIFLLILGTYIPISLLAVGGKLGWWLFGINTACAVIGIVLNSISIERWHKLSMVLYLIMGWLIIVAIRYVYFAIPINGMVLLVAGGVAYTLGVLFYKDKKHYYMHFIWHLFVVAGSVLQFFCIFLYCL